MAAGRYFRLTIPILAASFIGYLMMSAGLLYNQNIEIVLPDPWITQMMSDQIPSIYSWVKYSLYNVYSPDSGATGDTVYNPFLWTMPIELCGSFPLFGTTAIFGEKRVVRTGAFFVGFVVARLFCPVYALFFCGALLFEVGPAFCAQLGKRGANLVGLSLAGAAFLNSVFFRGHHETFAAAAIVSGVLTSPWLQFCMEARFSQFLGRISFPLYLTHCYIMVGPACWAILKLQALGFDLSTSAAVVSPLSVLASLVLAWLFAPIETASIRIARLAGSFLCAPRLPAFFVGRQDAVTVGQHQSKDIYRTPVAPTPGQQA
jgi:peptidoglycan/LPS O-acetylase OafA/YrhL